MLINQRSGKLVEFKTMERNVSQAITGNWGKWIAYCRQRFFKLDSSTTATWSDVGDSKKKNLNNSDFIRVWKE